MRTELGAQRNWRETDDLAMLFQGTYHSSFYRRVRDLLHAEVPAPDNERTSTLDAEWHELERREPSARTQRIAAASAGD